MRSAKSAAVSVMAPIDAKMKWSRESLNSTVEKPATKMKVVMINAVPTPVNALRMASLSSSVRFRSSKNRVRK